LLANLDKRSTFKIWQFGIFIVFVFALGVVAYFFIDLPLAIYFRAGRGTFFYDMMENISKLGESHWYYFWENQQQDYFLLLLP
jgi:hypothetical protein